MDSYHIIEIPYVEMICVMHHDYAMYGVDNAIWKINKFAKLFVYIKTLLPDIYVNIFRNYILVVSKRVMNYAIVAKKDEANRLRYKRERERKMKRELALQEMRDRHWLNK